MEEEEEEYRLKARVEEGANNSLAKDSIRKSSQTEEGAMLNIGIVEINNATA